MPKGVICGGAVEGSNQLGAIVTCQAMVACPDGAGWATPAGAPTTTAATRATVKSKERAGSVIIGSLLAIGSDQAVRGGSPEGGPASSRTGGGRSMFNGTKG